MLEGWKKDFSSTCQLVTTFCCNNDFKYTLYTRLTMRVPGSETTLIRVKDNTWNVLNSLKNKGDTFDTVIQRLLSTSKEAKLRISEEK